MFNFSFLRSLLIFSSQISFILKLAGTVWNTTQEKWLYESQNEIIDVNSIPSSFSAWVICFSYILFLSPMEYLTWNWGSICPEICANYFSIVGSCERKALMILHLHLSCFSKRQKCYVTTEAKSSLTQPGAPQKTITCIASAKSVKLLNENLYLSWISIP